VNLLSDVWLPLPLLIYGALALSSALLALALPETLNRTLPETLRDAQDFQAQQGTRTNKTQEIEN
jgi:OCT family organic cation transporter-like MFS transporter 4/5